MTTFAHTEVRSHHGMPTMFVDGTPLHGMTATSTAFKDPQVIQDFTQGGTEIMMIWIEAPLHCWKGPGQYDWSYAEERLRLFEENSGDTHWLIRLRLGLIADWWGQAHPTEVHSVHPQSGMAAAVIHSPLWLEHVSQVISDFVAWLKTTRWANRIIGFMINAGRTEEWLPYDSDDMFYGKYHPVIEREFRNWVKKEYATDQALQSAWNNPQITRETAGPPRGMARHGSHIWGMFTLRDPHYDRAAIDYYHYLNHTLADSLIHVCKTAKEAAQTPILCGGFHSYLWWESGAYSYVQEYGHTLVQKLNNSPYIDFISDITSYDGRYPGGPSGYLGLPQCQNLHQTLHYTEVDITTCANMTAEQLDAWKKVDADAIPPRTAEPAIEDRIWKWNLGMCGRDVEESIAIMQREFAHNLITGTPFWWFDIKKHSYAIPELIEAMKVLSETGKKAMDWDRKSASEVAFICSEETPLYQSAMSGSLLRFEMEASHSLLLDGCTRQWGLAGVPFDCYELEDLAHPDFPGDQYKLFIFVNCAKINDRAAEGIRRWQNNNRAFCWTFASACLDNTHFDPSLGQELIGMKLGCHKQRRNIHLKMNEDSSPLLQGGQTLNYGTEGSIGPVFFADDPGATVLGKLRDGGEPAFALRHHDGWNSIYLSMHNFGPALLRNLARYAKAHIWNESNDVIYANNSLVCLHTASTGPKTITLPAPATVTSLFHDAQPLINTKTIEINAPAYRTFLWNIIYD